MRTLETALHEARECLKKSNIVEYDIDAWYLMEHYFEVNRVAYMMNPWKEITEEDYRGYFLLIKQRIERKPVSYIIGYQSFMGYDFKVNEHVLIPRQDTELLVEEALKICNDKTVLDMCTGSGCIIISLSMLTHLKQAVGIDVSERALLVAEENKKLHNAQVTLLQSDLFERVEGTFDVIISNPPYIETDTILELMPEVKDHEPLLALDGKEDGLYFYRRIIKDSLKYLNEKGHILLEIGYNQGKEVRELLTLAGFFDVRIIKDLSGHDRVAAGCLKRG